MALETLYAATPAAARTFRLIGTPFDPLPKREAISLNLFCAISRNHAAKSIDTQQTGRQNPIMRNEEGGRKRKRERRN